jgi:hypothetical protein
VRYESRGGRKETDIVLAESPQMELTPFELAGKTFTPQMAAFREAWLGSKALAPPAQVGQVLPGLQAFVGL